LEYGLPPTGGFGLGIDRLTMMICDVDHLREVVSFTVLEQGTKLKSPDIDTEMDVLSITKTVECEERNWIEEK